MTESQDPQSEPLIPPRYWWLKRAGGAILALCICLTVQHISMMIVTQRRIDELVQSYRDAGQPVVPEDSNPKSDLAPERSAPTQYMRAIQAYVLPTSFPASLEVRSLSDLDTLQANLEVAARFVGTNALALNHCRQARALTEVHWNEPITSPITETTLDSLVDQRELVRLMGVASMYRHLQRNDSECVETTRDLLHLVSLMDAHPGPMIHHVYARFDTEFVSERIELIAPELLINRPTDATMEAFHASKDQVGALIDDLMDTAELRDRWRMAMWGERAYVLDTLTNLDHGPQAGELIFGSGWVSGPPAVALDYVKWQLVRPAWREDTAILLRYVSATADVVHSDYPRTISLLPAPPDFDRPLLGELRPAMILSPLIRTALRVHFRSIAIRRMAAIALAIRMYEVDHGRRPEALDRLVPEYMAEIPRDPFAADDRPIGYQPDGDLPRLYSVNTDGVDDKGEYEFREGGGIDPNLKDLVFFLDGNRPASALPTSQPISPSD